MTWRVCAVPGCPELTDGTRCAEHERARRAAEDARRGTATERGYDAEHRRLRDQVLAEETHCWICHQIVDKTLSGKHPDGPSADHVIRREDGGQNVRENYRLAHLRCNTGRRTGPASPSSRPRRTETVKRERPFRSGSISTT